MARLCGNKEVYLKNIHEKIEFLKVNSARAKRVKASKKLTSTMAKVLGAFMADGSLYCQSVIESKNKDQLEKVRKTLTNMGTSFSNGYSPSRKHYFVSFYMNYQNFQKMENLLRILSKSFRIQTHSHIEVSDEHKTNVESFNKWIKGLFNIQPGMFRKRGNEWRTIFNNKILSRYLICFFDVRPGPKTSIAFESDTIRKSSLSFRKAFAKGVLMFDGSATISGKIQFETNSKYLFNSISEIFTKSKINFGTRRKKSSYIISTYRNNEHSKLIQFFENKTFKWLRLREIYKKVDNNNFQQRYKEYTMNKITFGTLLKILDEIKVCDVNFLKKYFKCEHTTVSYYLKILVNNGEIILSQKPKRIDFRFVDKKTFVSLKDNIHDEIFDRIKYKFGMYENFAKFMNIHKSTLSAWKVRKNRIPLFLLKKNM